MATNLHIPALGEILTLAEDWEFTLMDEYRNTSLIEFKYAVIGKLEKIYDDAFSHKDVVTTTHNIAKLISDINSLLNEKLKDRGEAITYTKQAIPEQLDDIKKDAERYRWLREVSRDPDDGDVHCVITEEFLEKGKPAKMVSYLVFDEKLDTEIDKAMISASPTNTEVGE